jgi:hypothetical protein
MQRSRRRHAGPLTSSCGATFVAMIVVDLGF